MPHNSERLIGEAVMQEKTLEEAATWLTQLVSGEATEQDRQQWQRWHDRSEQNKSAWLLIEELTGKFQNISSDLTHAAVSEVDASVKSRRAFMKGLALTVIISPIAYQVYKTSTAALWNNDHRTLVGEIKDFKLPDGTSVVLNTNSAIDVIFDQTTRRVLLRQGEVLLTTSHADGELRDFQVETAQGVVQALGTRYSVHQSKQLTHVSVFDGEVEIRTKNTKQQLRLSAGQSVSFSQHEIKNSLSIDEVALAWTQGMLIVDDWPLDRFINELSRYRKGFVNYSPSVAKLRISGSFPLNDTDHILASLTETLPIKMYKLSNYWVSIDKR